MKYYKDTNNKMYADPLKTEGLTEEESPIWNGKILPLHKNLDKVAKDTDENYYEFYLDTPVDGIYQPDMVKTTEAVSSVALAKWKQDREDAVKDIKVTTTSGNTFDGDEESQTRMSRALASMDDGETTTWVLADNSILDATKAELREALRLSGQAQTALWVSV